MALTKKEEQLIIAHAPLAKKIANDVYRTASHALDKGELESIAFEWLVIVATRWESYCLKSNPPKDPNAVQFFPKYASLRIKGAMYDDMRNKERGWSSRALRYKSKQLRAAGQDQGASLTTMSEITGMSEKEINETINALSKRPVSLEGEDIDCAVVQSTESSVVVNYLLEVLINVIKDMDKISQTILALHYYQKKELQDISKIIGIKDRLSSDLHTKAVIKIRQELEKAVKGSEFNLEE